MWVLILTVISYYGSTTYPSSMTSVPGFTSYETCNAAARAWMDSIRVKKEAVHTIAVCAKQN